MAVDRERRHQKHRQMIMAKYKGICHICSEPYADAIDHVVPVAKGGSDHPDNLRPAHTGCNSRKGARSYPKWAEKNPNMWEPGHLPKKLREQREAEQLEKRKAREQAAREREALRQSALEKYQRLASQWDVKQATLQALRRDRPENPMPELSDENLGWITITTGLAALLFILFAFEHGSLGAFLGTAAPLVLLVSLLVYWGAKAAWFLLSPILMATIFRDKVAQYNKELEAWKNLVEDWESRPPLEAPAYPHALINGPATTASRPPQGKRSKQPNRRRSRRI